MPNPRIVVVIPCGMSTGGVFAVFEVMTFSDYRYLIYKLDDAPSSSELGKPIWSLKKTEFPMNMIFFSVGSKLYFTGGNKRTKDRLVDRRSKTYMLDFKPAAKNDKVSIRRISPMNSVKIHNPWVLGTIDGVKVYVITTLLDATCSFEVFDASSNKWETLPTPSIQMSNSMFRSFGDKGLQVMSSAICGSNILLYTGMCLYLFRTKSRSWHAFPLSQNPPFYLKAHPLSPFDENYRHVFLAGPTRVPGPSLPEVYTATLDLPPHDDFDARALFKRYGKVESLDEYVKEIPQLLGSHPQIIVFPLSYDPPRFCILRMAEGWEDHFTMDICSLSLLAGVNVKVENTVTYRQSRKKLRPRHFFEVPSLL